MLSSFVDSQYLLAIFRNIDAFLLSSLAAHLIPPSLLIFGIQIGTMQIYYCGYYKFICVFVRVCGCVMNLLLLLSALPHKCGRRILVL